MDIGDIVPVPIVWDLAKAWYTGRQQEEWRPQTAAETVDVFREVGLTGDFWEGT